MLMPSSLPAHFKKYETSDSDKALFEMLVRNPPDLTLFLEYGCSDETWAMGHSEFLNKAVGWVHSQFFQDRLLMETVQKLADVFRNHLAFITPYLPLNVTVKLKDRDQPINTLFYASSSEFLRELIRLECRDRKSKYLYFKELEFLEFSILDDFLVKRITDTLFAKDEKTVSKVLEIALAWDLPELAKVCQNFLKKWINRENVFDTLLNAHKNGWTILREECYDYVNNLAFDMRFVNTPGEQMAFEFLRYTENSMEVFKKVHSYITKLICSGTTTDERGFKKVVKQCPRLICLDISYSNSFTDYLKEIPSNLQELDLSSCLWLNNETFKTMLTQCPELNKLTLISDVELNFEAWGLFQNMHNLRTIDFTRCSQLNDNDIRIILQACEPLITLSLEDCRNISDQGFYDLSKYNPRFISLNLARTEISDQPLVELAHQCLDLTYLSLLRCEQITEKGVLEVVRSAQKLRELDISDCNVSPAALVKIKNMRPYLKLIS